MNSPYTALTFDWLIVRETDPLTITPHEGETAWSPFQIPAEMGHGRFHAVDLALGMSLMRGEHHLTPKTDSQLVPLAKIAMDFPELTFMTEVLRGGQLLQRSAYPTGEFLPRPGLDLFRLTDRLEMTPIMDGSHDVVGTSLTVGWSVLCKLLGQGVAESLRANLGLNGPPKVLVRKIPLHVSAHLHNALPMDLVGPVKKLQCQARVLDYLDALIDCLQNEVHSNSEIFSNPGRARDLHDFLVQTAGKLPTLDELANQFSCSAKKLNDEFFAEYGKSIYAFISGHRLEEAHMAILKSDVPMKKLAERLGYAHFNHFSAAFKKKFGYPPGSLRRK